MNKLSLGSVLMFAGVFILIASLLMYFNISGAQREMLLAQEGSVEDVEIPTMLGETPSTDKAASTPKQAIAEKKTAADRESYKNGQLTIAIPSLKIKAAVVAGTSVQLLKKGPGLYESSPLPDLAGGNVCIAGHRTTYGAWFRHVDKLEKGDELILDFEGNSYTYQVEKVFVVDKKDWSITEPVGYSAITLTSCHPLRSSKQRIVVRGKLIE